MANSLDKRPENPQCLNIPCADKFLSLGASGLVFAMDDDTVLKRSNGWSKGDEDIAIEKKIYERLGQHPSIVKCISIDAEGITLERLLYPVRKHLSDLHAMGQLPSEATVLRWANQLTRGIAYIHSRGVLQADIGCHNLLLDKENNVKLCDFGGASVDGRKGNIYYETRSSRPGPLDVTVGTEIFALGTALYELSTATPPYPDLDSRTRDIEKLYAVGRFPDTQSLALGNIIQKCWNGGYSTVEDVHVEIERLQEQTPRACINMAVWNCQSISSTIPRNLSSYIAIAIGFISLTSLSYIAIKHRLRR